MAVMAKRAAVVHVKPQLGKISEGLFVIGFQIASAVITAFSAFVPITGKYGASPFLISERLSDGLVDWRYTAFPCATLGTYEAANIAEAAFSFLFFGGGYPFVPRRMARFE